MNPEIKLNKPASQKINRNNSLHFSPKARKNMSTQEQMNFSLISGFEDRLHEL